MAIRAGEQANPQIGRTEIAACPSGILIVDENNAIVTASAEVGRLFGYRCQDLIGQPVECLLPGCSRNENGPEGSRLSPQGVVIGRRKDGTGVTVDISFHATHVNGHFVGVGSLVDVSERTRVDHLKDEFFATLSHELRTPMTSVHAALGLALAGAGELAQPVAHLLEIAYANCQRLVRMINDVLDLKKLDAGQMSFNYQNVDACSLLEKAIEANRALAEKSGIGIAFDKAQDCIGMYVDPDRFIQIVTNLLSNAIKFSPVGENVRVTVEKRGDNVHVAVRDRGPGIPLDFRTRIFDAFAQADSDVARQKCGSGLGLSIARRIATCMHGQIGFDDAPGGGMIFHVDLPGADVTACWQNEFPADKSLRARRR
jgi:PAS domain S-box-containing protein